MCVLVYVYVWYMMFTNTVVSCRILKHPKPTLLQHATPRLTSRQAHQHRNSYVRIKEYTKRVYQDSGGSEAAVALGWTRLGLKGAHAHEKKD